MLKCWYATVNSTEQWKDTIVKKIGTKNLKKWRKVILMISKTTRKMSSGALYILKKLYANRGDETTSRQDWALSESSTDTAMSTLITTNNGTWRTDGQWKCAMEGDLDEQLTYLVRCDLFWPIPIQDKKIWQI